ncbi:hypothetical protein ACQPU1_01860 [Clostridium paraputrificum]|uniref:hypothetical protein n=1 Tax=Clostridium paraputrificum TaxID=29363 RepID=UPI003D34D1E0
MRSDFKKIFWGFIFLVFDFNLFMVNIFPDFIGFFLIYIGCSSLAKEDISFEKASKLARLWSFLVFANGIRGVLYPFTNESLTIYSFLAIGIDLFLGIGRMYIVYHICRGIYNMAKSRDLNYLMDNCRYRWNFLFGTFVLAQCIQPFIYNVYSEVINAMLVILVVLQAIAYILIIALVNAAKKDLVVG